MEFFERENEELRLEQPVRFSSICAYVSIDSNPQRLVLNV